MQGAGPESSRLPISGWGSKPMGGARNLCGLDGGLVVRRVDRNREGRGRADQQLHLHRAGLSFGLWALDFAV